MIRFFVDVECCVVEEEGGLKHIQERDIFKLTRFSDFSESFVSSQSAQIAGTDVAVLGGFSVRLFAVHEAWTHGVALSSRSSL
jgi:hypothetical protein